MTIRMRINGTTAPGYQRNLEVGANRITVRATPIGRFGDAQLHHHRDADDHA